MSLSALDLTKLDTQEAFKQFASWTIVQHGNLTDNAAIIAGKILAESNPQQAMSDLWMHYRGPYTVAREASDKATATLIGSAWNGTRTAVTRALKRRGYVASWTKINTGKGDMTLVSNESAAEQKKTEREQTEEQNRKDAEAFQQQQRQNQLEATRALDLDQLVEQIKGQIAMSSYDLDQVVRKLANELDMRISKKPASKKRAA